MGITEIIRKGLANGDSYEVINKALADAGFNLKLVARDVSGWTEEEMKEGFNEGEPAKDVVHLADLMNRDINMANTITVMSCAEGSYRITRDADGYATKAVRI